jgi:glycosyltransferase involved in cell wall biosynthesis
MSRTVLIIPALDEEAALPRLLAEVPRGPVDEIIVVDNGSRDATARVSREGGARVVHEARRGYGAACLAGVAAAGGADIYVFMDGDGSADPREIPLLTKPLRESAADLVIGSRVPGRCDKGALLPQARWGNTFAAFFIRLLFGRRVSDLGPYRAVTAGAWRVIAPDDRAYGLPVQTQVRALGLGLRVVEVPVSCRRRVGRSKISGTPAGIVRAGWGILSTVFREWRRLGAIRRAG